VNNEGFKQLIVAIAEAGVNHVVASTYKAKRDSFDRVVKAFPELRGGLTELYWINGEVVGRARYLPSRLREELLRGLKEIVEDYGMTYATCREGLRKMHTGETCDGSHLIPLRRDLPKPQ